MPAFERCPCAGGTLDKLMRPAILSVLTAGPLHGYRLVERLVDRTLEPGSYNLSWQLPAGKRRPAPGVYYMRLESDERSQSRQLILLAP